MTDSTSPQTLRGIVPPMITPLQDRDALDVAGLERLIEHILAGGVHGLFILGTSGEAPSLSYRLRREVIARTCRQVRERVPVLVGVTDTAFVESVQLAQYAAECGADAVVLAAPYYFPAGQPELCDYLRRLTPELPLPLMLYNMPMMTKVDFAPETVRQVLDMPQIIGIKDSSGDMAYFSQVCQVARARPDWSLLMGAEQLLGAAIGIGANGGVCGGANVFPRLFVDVYEAAVAGDTQRVAELQRQVLGLGRIYAIGQHASAGIKGIKCSLSVLGVCADVMAEPFERFREPERAQIEKIIRSCQEALCH